MNQFSFNIFIIFYIDFFIHLKFCLFYNISKFKFGYKMNIKKRSTICTPTFLAKLYNIYSYRAYTVSLCFPPVAA